MRGLSIVGLLLLLTGCVRGREYELRGQVLAVDPSRQELTIKHGDIHGFMPGMTMPFKVRDPKLLAGRTAGDLVTATLVVRDDVAYLSAVDDDGARAAHRAAAGPDHGRPRRRALRSRT